MRPQGYSVAVYAKSPTAGHRPWTSSVPKKRPASDTAVVDYDVMDDIIGGMMEKFPKKNKYQEYDDTGLSEAIYEAVDGRFREFSIDDTDWESFTFRNDCLNGLEKKALAALRSHPDTRSRLYEEFGEAVCDKLVQCGEMKRLMELLIKEKKEKLEDKKNKLLAKVKRLATEIGTMEAVYKQQFGQ